MSARVRHSIYTVRTSTPNMPANRVERNNNNNDNVSNHANIPLYNPANERGDYNDLDEYHLPLQDILPADAQMIQDNLFPTMQWLITVLFLTVIIIFGINNYHKFANSGNNKHTSSNSMGKIMQRVEYVEDNEISVLNLKLDNLRKEIAAMSKKIEQGILLQQKSQTNPEDFNKKLETLMEMKIEEALKLYDADKVGQIDYALETGGATILSIPNTIPYPSRVQLYLMGLVNMQLNSNPRTLITPGTLPGQCFAFHGYEGRIRILLSHKIQIHSVTMEHANQNLLNDQRSTPRNFVVYGLNDPEEHTRGDELGQFVYQLKAKPLQTFTVDKRTNDDAKFYAYVELHILSNYGHPDYTCIYRFRVHGNR